MGRLDGKVIIITGASGGLGKQTAIRFAEEGAKVAICARTEEKLEVTKELCEKAGAEVEAVVADVCDFDSIKAFVDKTVERFGTVDVLVNNASTISPPMDFIDQDTYDLDEAIQSGLYGTWHMMQLCFPYLKEKGGSIINFGSMGGVLGMEGFASYAAEKEAIRGLSRVVAREWGQYGIRVNCVCPNVVTDRVEEGLEFSPPAMKEFLVSSMSDNAMKRMGYAYAEFTPAMVFLASDDSLWITGQTLPVDGGAMIHA